MSNDTHYEPHDSALDRVISNIFIELSNEDSDTDKFSGSADQLVKLMKLKKELNPSWRPSPDAIIGVVGTLATAILVLNYEKVGVVTSKAFAFIGRAAR